MVFRNITWLKSCTFLQYCMQCMVVLTDGSYCPRVLSFCILYGHCPLQNCYILYGHCPLQNCYILCGHCPLQNCYILCGHCPLQYCYILYRHCPLQNCYILYGHCPLQNCYINVFVSHCATICLSCLWPSVGAVAVQPANKKHFISLWTSHMEECEVVSSSTVITRKRGSFTAEW